MSAPTHAATDILGLGADWEPQNTTKATNHERSVATKANGDQLSSTTHGTNITITVPYIYIGAETTVAAALDADGCNVGEKPGDYIITGISIDFAPCGEGKKPVFNFSARGEFTAASNVFKPSVSMAMNPSAVPDILANGDADSECTSAVYSIQAGFGTDKNKTGVIIPGGSYGGEETLQLQYYGAPTLTDTGWDLTAEDSNNSNQEYSTTGYTYAKGVDRYVAP